jgi:hypothetical protein
MYYIHYVHVTWVILSDDPMADKIPAFSSPASPDTGPEILELQRLGEGFSWKVSCYAEQFF